MPCQVRIWTVAAGLGISGRGRPTQLDTAACLLLQSNSLVACVHCKAEHCIPMAHGSSITAGPGLRTCANLRSPSCCDKLHL